MHDNFAKGNFFDPPPGELSKHASISLMLDPIQSNRSILTSFTINWVASAIC